MVTPWFIPGVVEEGIPSHSDQMSEFMIPFWNHEARVLTLPSCCSKLQLARPFYKPPKPVQARNVEGVQIFAWFPICHFASSVKIWHQHRNIHACSWSILYEEMKPACGVSLLSWIQQSTFRNLKKLIIRKLKLHCFLTYNYLETMVYLKEKSSGTLFCSWLKLRGTNLAEYRSNGMKISIGN